MNRQIEVPIEMCFPLLYPQEKPFIWIRPAFLGQCVPAVMLRATDACEADGVVKIDDNLDHSNVVEMVENLKLIFGYQLPIVSQPQTQVHLPGHGIPAVNNYSNTNVNNLQGQRPHPQLTFKPQMQNQPPQSPNYSAPPQAQSYHHSINIQPHLPQSHFEPQGIFPPSQPQQQHVQVNNQSPHQADSKFINQESEVFGSASSSELLRERVESVVESKLSEISEETAKVLQQNSQLNEGAQILGREKTAISNEINLIYREIERVKDQQSELERCLQSELIHEMSERCPVLPDGPVSNKLIELLAEEAALMDALYAFIKVIVTPPDGKRTLPLTAGLRNLRELSRRHFLIKVQIKKMTMAV